MPLMDESMGNRTLVSSICQQPPPFFLFLFPSCSPASAVRLPLQDGHYAALVRLQSLKDGMCASDTSVALLNSLIAPAWSFFAAIDIVTEF